MHRRQLFLSFYWICTSHHSWLLPDPRGNPDVHRSARKFQIFDHAILYHTRVPYEILQATPVGIALRLCLNSVHIINFPSAFRLPHCFERRANQVFPRINTSTYLRLETAFQAVLVN